MVVGTAWTTSVFGNYSADEHATILHAKETTYDRVVANLEDVAVVPIGYDPAKG